MPGRPAGSAGPQPNKPASRRPGRWQSAYSRAGDGAECAGGVAYSGVRAGASAAARLVWTGGRHMLQRYMGGAK